MLVESRGRCRHGKRNTHYFEGLYCIMGESTNEKIITESCTSNHVFRRSPFIIATIIIIILLIIVAISIYYTIKSRREYRRLLQQREVGNIEMQGK